MKCLEIGYLSFINKIIIILFLASLFFSFQYKLMTTVTLLLVVFNLFIKGKEKIKRILTFMKINRLVFLTYAVFIICNSFMIFFIDFSKNDLNEAFDFFKYSLFIFIPILFIDKKEQFNNIIKGIGCISIAFICYIFYNHFILHILRASLAPTIDAYLLLMLGPFGIIALKYFKTSKIIYYIYFVLYIIALIFMETRAAWIAFAGTVIIILFLLRKYIGYKKIIIIIALSAIVISLFSPMLMQRIDFTLNYKKNYTIERVYIWKSSINIIKDNFFTGIGMEKDKFKNLYDSKYQLPESREKHILHPHNAWLYFFVTSGVLGCLTFVIHLLAIIKYFYNNYNISNLFVLVGIWFITVTIIGSIFEAYFYFDLSLKLYAILLSLIVMGISMENDKIDILEPYHADKNN